jgi:hypothetical protein
MYDTFTERLVRGVPNAPGGAKARDVEAARVALAATDVAPAALWFTTTEPAYAEKTNATAIHAVVYVVAIWTWTFAVMGAALRFLSAYRAGIRYLADASYWVYLVHAPVVMVIHVVLTLVGWPPLLKFLVVITVATAVCLATYQIIVRHTLIGLVLNGRRGGTGVPDVAHAPAPVGVAVT